MTLFYFIRHAQSDCNKNSSHLVGGRASQTPLSPEGIIQAQMLGYRLKREGVRFDNWIASSAVRAIHTAQIVMEIVDPTARLIIEETIEEISQGDWEGRLRTECYTEEAYAQIAADNWNFKAPNGESQREVETRMMAFTNKWIENSTDATNAVFTHGIAIKCLMRGIYDWNKKMTFPTDMHNTSMTVVEYKNNGWRVDRMNDHAHILSVA